MPYTPLSTSNLLADTRKHLPAALLAGLLIHGIFKTADSFYEATKIPPRYNEISDLTSEKNKANKSK